MQNMLGGTTGAHFSEPDAAGTNHTVFIPESIELFVGVRATGKNETEITRNDYRKLIAFLL